MMPEKEMKAHARAMFDAALKAADPREAIRRNVRISDGTLVVGPWSKPLDEPGRIFVVGAGKAAWPMASALEEILGAHIFQGRVTTKYGHGGPLKTISLGEAGHPVPDESGAEGTRRILNMLEATRDDDLVICLISGGGSALMPLPALPLDLKDKQTLTAGLLASGASIHEINALRKHLSGIKGGQLALAAAPATVVSLILSDVIGDDLDVIASGPTVPDRSTYSDCLKILERYAMNQDIPESVRMRLSQGAEGAAPETPKPGHPAFQKVHNVIIGSSALSIKAAGDRARELGYNTMILSTSIEGETRDVAGVHAAVAREVLKSANPLPSPACILSGGETTVVIRGKGRGGRNQEFALAAALAIDGVRGLVILSGGTDGTDGPTDAAGALVDGASVASGRDRGMDARDYLDRNDSYSYFEGTDDHLITGPTLTNVMDLRIVLVDDRH